MTFLMFPIVAIIGRANVGKSRLFNRIVGGAPAMVHDEAGVTRDRHYKMTEWNGREFVLVDTGGIVFQSDEDLEKAITHQSFAAIEEADVVIALFDGRQAPNVTDLDLIASLRKISTPVIWVINKVDVPENQDEVLAPYQRQGVQPLLPVSAEHGLFVGELLDAIVNVFPPPSSQEALPEKEIAVAIVGRPNVGKSTLINTLCGEPRVVVHETPGTTRDAIDVHLAHEDKTYCFVDTAGIHRHYRVASELEKWTALRSLKAIERCSVACLVVDVTTGLTHHEKTLIEHITESGKGLVILLNKWDLDHASWENMCEDFRYGLREFSSLTIQCVSAKTGEGCQKIFSLVNDIHTALTVRLSTARVNQLLEEAQSSHPIPSHHSKHVRILYGTQIGVCPPTFALFANDPRGISRSYERYLAGEFMRVLGGHEIPVRLKLRKKT